jgi:RES domain-containing protein
MVFRHADPRFPFLWETTGQPAARWHDSGEGPVHYFSETPDGAWAEFLRHEEIVDPADLAGVVRSLWSIELPHAPRSQPRLDSATLTGGISSYPACRREARRIRSLGGRGLVAPSAAIESPSQSGFRAEGGLQPGPLRDERVLVLFGPRPDLIGWAACHQGRPRADLLPRVRPLAP